MFGEIEMIKEKVLKNGKTVYDAYIYLGTDQATGERKSTVSRGHPSIKAAKLAKIKIKAEWENDNQKVKRLKFKDVYDAWAESHYPTVAPATVDVYEQAYRLHVAPYLDKYYVDSIDVALLTKVARKWESNLTSVQAPRLVTKQVLNYGIYLKAIETNPMMFVKFKRKTKNKAENYYKIDELEEFLRIAKENSDRTYFMFRLLAFSGLRVGEMCALTWDDVNLATGDIAVNKTVSRDKGVEYIKDTPKTSASNRTIRVDDQTLAELNSWYDKQPNVHRIHNRVLHSTHGHSFTQTNTVRGNLSDFVRKHKLKKITPHGFRHTHCSLLIAWGYDIKRIQKQLGHEKIETTLNVYSHLTKDDNIDISAFLNDNLEF